MGFTAVLRQLGSGGGDGAAAGSCAGELEMEASIIIVSSVVLLAFQKQHAACLGSNCAVYKALGSKGAPISF